MQPDFFEHPETTRLKHLMRKRQALLQEIGELGDEIQQTFRETNSWALNAAETLRIVTLPTGGTYIYEIRSDKADRDQRPILMAVDVEYFICAAKKLHDQRVKEGAIP
jgi:hypothetical protein